MGTFNLFYSFVLITVLLNMVLLFVTSCKMRSIRKHRTMPKDERNNYNIRLERET